MNLNKKIHNHACQNTNIDNRHASGGNHISQPRLCKLIALIFTKPIIFILIFLPNLYERRYT